MMVSRILLLICLMAIPAGVASAEDRQPMKVVKNIGYKPGTRGRRTELDIYSPANAKKLPVMIWFHGGDWLFGDKRGVQEKPRWFTEQGFVFVSINYRMHPQVNYTRMAGDVASAIHWVHQKIDTHGGDPGQLYLMGHSAGAHLAALVATDEQYLKQKKLTLKHLSGVILLDGAGYDIPRQVNELGGNASQRMYRKIFGEAASQKQASPITHVAAGKDIPPFLLLHVASRTDSKAQADSLGAALNKAGSKATVVPAYRKTHNTINQELGTANDPPTEAARKFLDKLRAK